MILIISKDLTKVKRCRTIKDLEACLWGLDIRKHMLVIPATKDLPPRTIVIPSANVATTITKVKDLF